METLILLHIEKCGGTSLRHAVEQALPTGSMYNFFSKWDYHIETINKHREIGKTYKVINGHFNYGMHEHLGLKPNYTAQMREPVDRFISHYTHWMTHRTNNQHYEHMIKNCDSMAKFLNDPLSLHLNNFMTRRLCGNLRQVPLTKDDFALALERLNNMKFITFLEQAGTGITQRAWNFQLGSARIKNVSMKHLNKKHFKAKVYSSDMKRIEEANEYDILLYKRARHLQIVTKGWSE